MPAAVIVLLPGNAPVDKQEAACLDYLACEGIEMAGRIGPDGDRRNAVTMVQDGRAQLVVVPWGGRDLVEAVTAAGGYVIALRPTPHMVQPPASPAPRSINSLLSRLRAKGRTVEQIAAFLDTSTDEIRRMLKRD